MKSGQTSTDPSVVRHVLPRAQSVIREYLEAFSNDSSVLVVAPQLVDTVHAQQSLAGWHVTDCTSRFERVAPLAVDAASDQLILGTSGTTGGPKLVRHDKSVLRGCAAAIAARLNLDRARDYVSLANPRFAFGLSILHSHALAGVPVRFQSAPTSLEQWARLRATLRPNSSVYLAPHQSFLLAQDPLWRLDGPVELILAGSPVRRRMVTALESTFPSATLVVMYGQAELGPRISTRCAPISEFEEGNTGRPLPGVRVRSAGRPGALEFDSPFRMKSYVDITGATIAAEHPLDTPWLATGDHGFVSASGDVHVVQRGAADVNFLGTRVRLEQLREAVRAVAGVLDVRAAAVPHDVYGQRPHLRILVPHLDAVDALEREVRMALATNIGTAASAVVVELVDLASLPESGKL